MEAPGRPCQEQDDEQPSAMINLPPTMIQRQEPCSSSLVNQMHAVLPVRVKQPGSDDRQSLMAWQDTLHSVSRIIRETVDPTFFS